LGFGKQIQASVQIRELLTQQSTKLGLGMQIGGNTGIRHAGSPTMLGLGMQIPEIPKNFN